MPLFWSFDHHSCANDLCHCRNIESRGSAGRGATMIRAVVNILLSLSRASSASTVHAKCSAFFSYRYNGNAFSPSREMKRLSAARQPITFCTPLTSRIGPILVMAETFPGLASMPRSETMYPRSMPQGTPKTHFSGLSLILLARRQPNAISRSRIMSPYILDLTMMSSTYASTIDPMCSLKTWSMHRWYVALAIRSLKGMVT